jgi:hypothetical protein
MTREDMKRQIDRWAKELGEVFPAGTHCVAGYKGGRGVMRFVWVASAADSSSRGGKVNVQISDTAIFEYLKKKDADDERALADERLRSTLRANIAAYDFARDGEVTWSILTENLNG